MLGEIDPAKDADGLHPTNLGWLVLGKPAPLPCTPFGIVELLRRHDVEINGADVVVVGRGVTVGRPLGPAAHPPLRERHRHAVPHRHPRPRRPRAPGRHRGRRGRRARASSPATWSSPAPPCSTSASPGSTASSRATSTQSVYDVAGWVSPNPGGVGPMTRAMLLSNVVAIARGHSAASRRAPSRRARRTRTGAASDPVHRGRAGLPDRRRDQRGRPADRRVRSLASRRRPDRARACSSVRWCAPSCATATPACCAYAAAGGSTYSCSAASAPP